MITKEILFKDKTYTIHQPGSILSNRSGYFIDQIDGFTEVFAKNFRLYLRNKYDLTLEEYYCLVVFGTENDSSLYCPYCGSKRIFSGNLSNGYRSICPNCKKTIRIINNDLINEVTNINGYDIISAGRIVQVTNHKIYDQLDVSLQSYFILNRFSNIKEQLKLKYNLTEEQYYNLVVNGDKDFIPTCRCGRKLEFRGVINGYHKRCILCKGRNVPYEDEVKEVGDYLIHYPGRIAKASHNMFINQLNLKVYSNSNKMMEDITRGYNLTEEQYYNLVVYGDKDAIHICSREGCNNNIPYRGFYEGFRNTCSTECTNLMRWSLSGEEGYTFYSLDPKLIYQSYSSLNKGKISNFYLTDVADDPDFIKIGITINMKGRAEAENYVNYKIMYTDEAEKVARLEYLVKVRFKKYAGKGKYPTESFPREMKSEIENFILLSIKEL